MTNRPPPGSESPYVPQVFIGGQFTRFAFVGAIGFCVDIAVLYLSMSGLGLGVYSGRVVSYFAAATATWYLNRRITFTEIVDTKPLRQWFRFVLTNSFGGLVNYGVYSAIVFFWASLPYAPFLGVAAGSIAGLVLNFAASKSFVFRQSTPPPAEETPPISTLASRR